MSWNFPHTHPLINTTRMCQVSAFQFKPFTYKNITKSCVQYFFTQALHLCQVTVFQFKLFTDEKLAKSLKFVESVPSLENPFHFFPPNYFVLLCVRHLFTFCFYLDFVFFLKIIYYLLTCDFPGKCNFSP